MKRMVLLIVLGGMFNSCGGSSDESERGSESCTYNGHRLYVGEKGGCYYLSSGGSKEYVDKSYCIGCN
ncbi:hypothetical protein [Chryseobacterium sp.]|uniref:hypothetical protein n=1 Tax=Chryseobacterium sp. TaxID=1871047 RepID=UPI0024E1F13A|nr:hypothetical protein [Chryseobacterium sp.]